MIENGSSNGHRRGPVIDWHLNLNGVVTTLALLMQIAVLVFGGIRFEAGMQAQVDSVVQQLSGVREEIKGIRGDVGSNASALRDELGRSVTRLDARIDRLRPEPVVVPYVPAPAPGYTRSDHSK